MNDSLCNSAQHDFCQDGLCVMVAEGRQAPTGGVGFHGDRSEDLGSAVRRVVEFLQALARSAWLHQPPQGQETSKLCRADSAEHAALSALVSL